jgi:hypothetical protein
MALRQQPVYKSSEDDILTAMIASTAFMEQAIGWYRPEYFTDYAQLIAEWVVDYYRQYRQAPGKTIQNIYNIKKEKIPPALAANVATYLTNLSTQYDQQTGFNVDYMLDTARQYFKRRSYEHLFNQGRELIKAGQVDEAIALHEDFRGVAQTTSKWENPFERKVINTHFSEDASEYQVLEFRGALGELVGPLERNWLVAFMGPMKRGKSFWCEESIFAGLAGRRKVAYINLEMPDRTVRAREYKRITALPDKANRYIMPQFDCMKNQQGMCVLPERIGRGTLVYGDDLPTYTPGHPWKVCTYCRDYKDRVRQQYGRNDFVPVVWYSHVNKRGMDAKAVHKAAAGTEMMLGDGLRQITYPAYSATVDDVRRDLDELIYAQKFYPDIVVLDYADILGSEQGYNQERHRLDNIWKRLKQAAGEMSALWITATQTNRKAIDKGRIHQTDTAEDIRKVAHVDAMYGLNQTEKDQRQFLTRITQLASRHREPDGREAGVLHQLALGLPYLDSEWWPERKGGDDTKSKPIPVPRVLKK